MKDAIVLPADFRSRLFESVVEFMGSCGANEVAIREAFESALVGLSSGRKTTACGSRDKTYIKRQNLPALLLRIWHRESRYIDSEAKPRPLSLTRGRNNLRSVVERIDPSIDAVAALRSMKKAGLIRRTASGKYLPASKVAIVDQLHPLMVEHVTRLIGRLVGTVGRNTNRSGRSLSLVDRHAYTTDLNPEERRAFAEFTRSQGMVYLESIDDWLEQRRLSRIPVSNSRRKGKKGVAAGVYLFAYLGDKEGIQGMHLPAPSVEGSRARRPIKSKRTKSRKPTSPRATRA